MMVKTKKARKQHLEVSAALIRHEKDGRFLITQRRLDDFLGGLWEFPGGKRRRHESFEGCLKREVKEETGLTVEVGARHKAVTYEYSDRIVSLLFYWARVKSGTPKPIGCRAFKWVLPQELLDYTFPPADQDLILELSRPENLFCN